MNAATRAVIERLTDVTTFLLDIVEKVADGSVAFPPSIADPRDAIADARKLLEDDGWIRVEYALPVVPEGKSHVTIWCGNSAKGEIWRSTFLANGKMHRQATHWQLYATPQPPKG